MPKKTPSIFILTGAGISAESGLATFRGSDGLWENHPIEEVASIDGYRRNPKLVQDFYNMRRRQIHDPKLKPNAAHEALVELENQWPGDFLLVTQNVDNLHDRAGSRRLIHMHGELSKVHCESCSKIFEWSEDVTVQTSCPSCRACEKIRPDFVWFGEMPREMDRIYDFLEACDYFVSIGTSGLVYPAAGFISVVQSRPQVEAIEINLEPTPMSGVFDRQFVGPASIEVPKFTNEIIRAVSSR